MMLKTTGLAAVLAAGVLLAGCSVDEQTGSRAGTGAAVGAAGGAAVGVLTGSVLKRTVQGAVAGGAGGFIYDQVKKAGDD